MVTISFCGDISLFQIDEKKFSFCSNYEKLRKNADLFVGNLECPITTNSQKEDYQAVNMAAGESSLELLKGFDVVSLANNHIRDFREKGIKDTINALQNRNILHFGAGKTISEAAKPLILEKNNLKIAFLGATRYANANSANKWGTAPDKMKVLRSEISNLKQNGFFVVLYFHWGYEYVRYPSPRERNLAHRCIHAGADLIIGAHPHIYQGIEVFKGKTIVYSLGNFIFHSSVFKGLAPVENDPRLNESFIFQVKINPDLTYASSIIGYETSDEALRLYDQEENAKLLSDIEAYSAVFNSSYYKYLKVYYRQAVEISRQNIKVRKDFQEIDRLSTFEKLRIFRTANSQDIKNRLAALYFTLLNPR